jgi:methyl-accepting chemotaxis protein
MTRRSANSLKSKIWLATSALAFFIFSFGIGTYLIISLFTENSFYSALIQLLFIALAVVVFGRWLSNEAVSPIEKVSLLAKSLERGVTTSLPKTSGSSETDELLQTLHRNHQQLQNLVGLMDKVSSGNLDVALTPLKQSDRLSNSFQKLLAKVTESINAKQDLELLKGEIQQITEEITAVRDGNFDVEIKSDFAQTKEVSETLKFLIHQLNELINQVKCDSKQTSASAKEVQKTIQNIIGTDENRIREMNQTMLTLKRIPESVKKISEELFASTYTAKQSIENARNGSEKAQKNVSAVNVLRQQIREAVKRTGKLSERAQEIGKIAKTVEDLAQRTNMIALNASIQAAETGERNRGGFVAFTEEVERLAERAANTNKQISTLNKTMRAEVGEIERSLQDSVSEAANLSRFALETGNSLSELEKYIQQFLNLQEKFLVYSNEQAADTETAFQNFIVLISEAENAVENLKGSETQISQIMTAMENLQAAVANFKTSGGAPEKDSENNLTPDYNMEIYT